jgi:hypothetical protein
MKNGSLLLAAAIAVGCVGLNVSAADAGLLDWVNGTYRLGRAAQDLKRNDRFGAVDQLLQFPTPTNPYRYLPKSVKEGIRRDIRKIDPATRYGPEYQDLFR